MSIRRSRRSHRAQIADVEPIVRLWLLRLLVPLGGHREFIERRDFRDDALAATIGLAHWISPVEGEFDPVAILAELRKFHAEAEQKLHNARVPAEMAENISRLAGWVDLSGTDCRILEFAVLIHNERLLDDTAEWLGNLSSVKVCRVLSVLLNIPEPAIRASLSARGLLSRSGLVSVDRNGPGMLRRKLDLLSYNFADLILTAEADPVTLLRDTVAPSGPPQLEISDYDHITRSLDILLPYLRQAHETKRRGVNVFIHGDPGTGKSQLAKVLAKELGCELFEVACENEDGDPVGGDRRLCAFRAAQSFFTQHLALILFDEAEDVFNDGNRLFGERSTAQIRKAWVNRMLEENPLPTLWVSNSAHCLDPAFIRRFDLVIELPVPPRSQRERIVRDACGDMLPDHSVQRLAGAGALAPAVIARAASVVRSIRSKLPENAVAGAVEHLVSRTLETQGHGPLKRADPNQLPEYYDPAFIHANVDLVQVAAGLKHSRSGRLCFHGPPGTGKTACGRWLADQLDVPLVTKRASDLLSMYVGENEKNIANVFREAEEEQALLLIDEVDSFLQDRRGARRFWEVTAVNEMLTQMECFPGLFIASTNRMTGLDPAALRRFDLKVNFDYLRPDQSWELLQKQCRSLSIPPPEERLKVRLARLAVLTPGDFATVARQHRFHPIRSAAALIDALAEECELKEDGMKAGIGFT